MGSTKSIKARVRPEVTAGGFTYNDGTIAFYDRVRALLSESDLVLDFGAGRGAAQDDPVTYRRSLVDLRGAERRVVGVDVDEVVLGNPFLDQAYHIGGGDSIPLETGAVQTIVADWVFEHISYPHAAVAELDRVLGPVGYAPARPIEEVTSRLGHVLSLTGRRQEC